jgi:hypothetical protein
MIVKKIRDTEARKRTRAGRQLFDPLPLTAAFKTVPSMSTTFDKDQNNMLVVADNNGSTWHAWEMRKLLTWLVVDHFMQVEKWLF